jgi:YaiO family outer membrane protein
VSLILVITSVIPSLGVTSELIREQREDVRELVALGQYDEALPILEAMQLQNPEDIEIGLLLARSQRATRRIEAAIETYEGLLTVQPENLEIQIERARLLVWMGRFSEAAGAVEEIVLLEPEATEAWAVLSDARRGLGDRKGARNALEEGLKYSPESASLLARLARDDYRAGDIGSARLHMQQALESDPEAVEAGRGIDLYSPFVVDLTFVHDDISRGKPWNSVLLSTSWRPRGPWSLRFEVEGVERFGNRDMSFRAFARHRLSPRITFGGGVHAAAEPQIVSQGGIFLEAIWQPVPLWRMEGSLQELTFQTGTVSIVSAAIYRYVGGAWEFGYRGFLIRDLEGDDEYTHSVRLLWANSSRMSIYIAGFRGTEVLSTVTVADLRSVTTMGVSLVGRRYVTRRWAVRLVLAYADREAAYVRKSFGIGLVRHF